MTKKQLAALYGVCVKTFNKWLKPFIADIGEIAGTNILTPDQVNTIFNKLGKP